MICQKVTQDNQPRVIDSRSGWAKGDRSVPYGIYNH